MAAARHEDCRTVKPMIGDFRLMIFDAVEAALRRLLDENNHLTLAECRDRLAEEIDVRVHH